MRGLGCVAARATGDGVSGNCEGEGCGQDWSCGVRAQLHQHDTGSLGGGGLKARQWGDERRLAEAEARAQGERLPRPPLRREQHLIRVGGAAEGYD